MFFKRKLKAFSLVEVMMLLMIASLIMAALVPVVTKKHFGLPSLVNHGAYMCYYKDGKLREAKWAGKMQQKVLFDRETENCVFVPPKKAAYFQISAIGGGGGGGDSGYHGGNWISEYTSTMQMSPFGITEEGLKNLNIDPEEFKKYAGTLIGYARSVGSGAGGDISYAVQSCEDVCTGGYGSKQSSFCARYEDVTSADWNEESKTCSYTTEVEVESCSTYEVEEEYSWCDPCGECTAWAQGEPIKHCTKKCVKTETIPGKEGCSYSCRNGNSSSCSTGSCSGGDSSGGCKYQSCTTPSRTECTQYEEVCTETPGPTICTSNKAYTTHTGTHTIEKETCSTSMQTLNGSHSNKDSCSTGNQCVETDYNWVTDYDNCLGWTTNCSYPVYTQSGNSGASGASCQSSGTPGNLGLAGFGGSTFSGDGEDGANHTSSSIGALFCSADTAESGKAACYNSSTGSYTAANCGADVSYAYYNISRNGSTVDRVKADSASAGGGGGIRGGCSDTSDSHSASSQTAVNGSCAEGTIATTCSVSGDYGYCLKHYGTNTVESSGQYVYRYAYDNNYLGYGKAGSPGEFKTIIVRSLKGIDTTIKIGRGGSAAAIDLGQAGANGSATSMGNIITAAGGIGGAGSQSTTGEILPTYNKERYDKESVCYFYDKYMAKNPDGTWVDPEGHAKLAAKLSSEPNYCDGMINNQGAYKYFKVSATQTGEYPTPIGIASSIMNFVFNKVNDSEILQTFTKFGRGGKGGVVEHRCWAGRNEVEFEGVLLDTSVFVDKESATAKALANHLYVPDGCRKQYSNIAAGPGVDGALLIKW